MHCQLQHRQTVLHGGCELSDAIVLAQNCCSPFMCRWPSIGRGGTTARPKAARFATWAVAPTGIGSRTSCVELRGARAGYFPTISGSAGARRDVGDFSDDDLQFTVGADAAWEVDLFGQISGNVAASRADLLAAGYSLADIQRLIVGQVASQAIAARAFSEQLAIARSSLAFQDDNLQLARWRNQAGLVSSLDVEQARTQRAQTAASIPLLESNLVATANAISTLIGEPPGRVLAASCRASARHVEMNWPSAPGLARMPLIMSLSVFSNMASRAAAAVRRQC